MNDLLRRQTIERICALIAECGQLRSEIAGLGYSPIPYGLEALQLFSDEELSAVLIRARANLDALKSDRRDKSSKSG